MPTKFETSTAEGGVHHWLAQLAGEWTGTNTTWFKPDTPADKPDDKSEMHGTIRPILSGKFMLFEYEGKLGKDEMVGVAIIGCRLASDRAQIVWVDTVHCGTEILFFEGKDDAAKAGEHRVLGSYDGGGEMWGWETVITLPDPNRLVITHNNIPPEKYGAAPYKGVEWDLRRA